MAQHGLQIFTGDEVAKLDVMRNSDTVYPDGFNDDPDANLPSRGVRTRVMFQGDHPNGYSLLAVVLAPHAIIRRHYHDTDCLYLVSEGEITMGSRAIKQGGGFFVAAEQPYTYQAGSDGACVLEVRGDTTFSTTVVETHHSALLDNARSHLEEWDAYFEATDRVNA